MKNYFKFNLTGQKLLPVWLTFLVLFMVPYFLIIFKMKELQTADTKAGMYLLPVFLVLIIVAFIFSFLLQKLSIEGIEYKENSLVFNGKLGKFFGIVLLGGFLTTITLGIYGSWFIKSIQKFFIDNSSYKEDSFTFNGTGGKLFVILLLTLMLPILIIVGYTSYALIQSGMQHGTESNQLIIQLAMLIILIPYMYFVYKWMVDVTFKSYQITWKTNVWQSLGKIFVEIILSIITLGIYAPLASLKLYKYFTEKTVAISENSTKTFGYDIEPLDDFLFIWGQTLLAIVTLGIYYPWAFCKVRSRILSKTFVEEVEVA